MNLKYSHLLESRYASQVSNYDLKYKDEVGLHLYDDSGEFVCEGFIRWYDLGTETLHPRLEVFSDAWALFGSAQIACVLGRMAECGDVCVAPRDVIRWLKEINAQDVTAYPVKQDRGKIVAEMQRLTKQIQELASQLGEDAS